MTETISLEGRIIFSIFFFSFFCRFRESRPATISSLPLFSPLLSPPFFTFLFSLPFLSFFIFHLFSIFLFFFSSFSPLFSTFSLLITFLSFFSTLFSPIFYIPFFFSFLFSSFSLVDKADDRESFISPASFSFSSQIRHIDRRF